MGKILIPGDLAQLNVSVQKQRLIQLLGQMLQTEHNTLLDGIRERYVLSGPITYDSKTGEIQENQNG